MRIDSYSLTTGRVVIIDTLVVAGACLLPAWAHYFSFPVYYLDPMRLGVFIGLILVGSRNNALILAFLIPFISWVITGHPVGLKAILIAVELTVNILLFYQLYLRPKWPVSIALFCGIAGSKLLYYALKYLLLQGAYLTGELVSTPLWIQLASAFILTGFLTYLFQKQRKNAE